MGGPPVTGSPVVSRIVLQRGSLTPSAACFSMVWLTKSKGRGGAVLTCCSLWHGETHCLHIKASSELFILILFVTIY